MGALQYWVKEVNLLKPTESIETSDTTSLMKVVNKAKLVSPVGLVIVVMILMIGILVPDGF